MNKILLCISFSLFNISLSAQEKASYELHLENSDMLYLHAENKISIEPYSETVKLYFDDNRGTVENVGNGIFLLKPSKLGFSKLWVKNSKTNSNEYLLTIKVISGPLPSIIPGFSGRQAPLSTIFNFEKGNISINQLKEIETFFPFSKSDFGNIRFRIESFDILIYTKDGKEKSEFKGSTPLSLKAKDSFHDLNPGDFFILKNVVLKSFTKLSEKNNPDQYLNCPPIVYFITE